MNNSILSLRSISHYYSMNTRETGDIYWPEDLRPGCFSICRVADIFIHSVTKVGTTLKSFLKSPMKWFLESWICTELGYNLAHSRTLFAKFNLLSKSQLHILNEFNLYIELSVILQRYLAAFTEGFFTFITQHYTGSFVKF